MKRDHSNVTVVAPLVLGALLLAFPQASHSQSADRAGADFAWPPHQALVQQSRPARTVEIVVKFRDDGKIKDIVALFWKDSKAASDAFDLFKVNRPDMIDASLSRVTYSSELVLAFPCKKSFPADCLTAAREIAARLMSAPDISYA